MKDKNIVQIFDPLNEYANTTTWHGYRIIGRGQRYEDNQIYNYISVDLKEVFELYD